MRRYDHYKNSGIEWIGEIPEHWEVKRLKYVASSKPSNVDKKSKEEESKVFLCNYVDVYKNEFITHDIDFMEATASKSQIENFTLKRGDVIATKDSESPDDIAVPAIVKEDFRDVVCGYHLNHIRPIKIFGDYLFRLFQSKYSKSYFETVANGITRYGVGAEKFSNFLLLLPLNQEQASIATYLDRKTAEIDQLIADKKRLLELYEEEKTAIINQAVTKGIHPDVPMKDSGIEWLGEMPEHWEIDKYKWITERLIVGIAEAATDSYRDSGIPIIRSTNIKDGKIKGDILFIDERLAKKNESRFMRMGDIVTVRTGNAGQSAVIPANLNMSQCFTLLISTLKKGNIPTFYNYVINSTLGTTYFDVSAWGTAQKNISVPILGDLLVPSLPTEEQRSIVSHIESECARIDAKQSKTQKLIDLLTEYRTALISEVVTGKVKVID
jgi:type I restriction enzyme, S subunit